MKSNELIKPRVLTVLACTGEMSYKALRLLRGESSRKSENLKVMEEKGWIARNSVVTTVQYRNRIKKNSVKRIVLKNAKKNFTEWQEYVPCVNSSLIQETIDEMHNRTNNYHERQFFQSEAVAMMLESDIEVVDLVKPENLKDIYLPNISSNINSKYNYYMSTAIKRSFKYATEEQQRAGEEIRTLGRSRAIGTLFTPEDIFSVFCLGRKKYMQIDENAEMKYYNFTQKLKSGKIQFEEKERRRIFFTTDLTTLKDITFGGYNFYQQLGHANKNRDMLKTSFSATHVIQQNLNGEKLLELLAYKSEDYFNQIIGIKKQTIYSNIYCDKLTQKENGEKIYELNFLTQDIQKLRRFIVSINLQGNAQNEEYIIHCFKDAAEELNQMKLEKVQIKEHNLDDIFNEFLMEA